MTPAFPDGRIAALMRADWMNRSDGTWYHDGIHSPTLLRRRGVSLAPDPDAPGLEAALAQGGWSPAGRRLKLRVSSLADAPLRG